MEASVERIEQIRDEEGWSDATMAWLIGEWLRENPIAVASLVAFLELKQQDLRDEEAREAATEYEEGL